MKKAHPIVYIADEGYLKYLPANIDQVSRYGAEKQLIYVVTTATFIPAELSSIGKKYPQLDIVFKQVNFQDYVNNYRAPKKTHVTEISLLKFFLPEILSEDVVLYLDIDTLICAPLFSLLAYYPSNSIAAVEELGVNSYLRNQSASYFNAGVIVMSLQKIKNLGIYEQINNLIADDKSSETDVDQDIFNYIFEGLVDFLPQKFNVFQSNCDSYLLGVFARYPTIVHFVGRDKPWKYPSKSKYSRLWIESFASGTKPNPSSSQLAILSSKRGALNISGYFKSMGKIRVKLKSRIKMGIPKEIKDILRNYI